MADLLELVNRCSSASRGWALLKERYRRDAEGLLRRWARTDSRLGSQDMPVPLYTDVYTYFSPPYCPPFRTWGKDAIEKQGSRWVTGDDKEQILEYYGRTVRGKSILIAPNPPPGLGYYSPQPFVGPYSGNDWILNAVPSYGVATVNKAYSRFKDVAVGEIGRASCRERV